MINLFENKPPLILIVDDDKTLRLLLCRTMEIEGYRIAEAEDGEQCLELCQQLQPDMVLLDAMMPKQDGFTCCAQLTTQLGDNCPTVLMVTTLNDKMSVERAIQVGATDYVTKPIDWPVLLMRVQRLLQSRWAMTQLRQRTTELTMANAILHTEINARQRAELHIQTLNIELEQRINERTAALRCANEKLTDEINKRQRVEEQLRLFVEYAPVAVAMFDRDMRYLLTSRRWLQDYGLSNQNLSGRSHYEVFPDISERWQEIYKHCLAGSVKQCEEEQFLRADGSREWVRWEIHPWNTQTGETSGIIIFTEVISERKRAEEALQQSEERMRLAVESTGVGTWDYNPITGTLQWSDRCKAIFGLPPEAEVSYDTFLSCLHPEDRAHTDTIARRALDSNSSGDYNIEYRTLWPDGTVRWAVAIGRAFFNEKNQAYRFIGTILDITERKLAEELLKASFEEKVVLLREIHHRVKNNLQIIASLLSLQSNYVYEPQTLELLQSGQNRVASMALIHEQLYQTENLSQIEVAAYIQNLIANLFSSYEIRGTISLHMNIEEIYLDIEQAIPCGLIINELICNSLKYAFPQGAGEIHISFYSDNNNKLTLFVSDNGIGIPQELNWQSADSLGLKLVNTLAEQLDGTLELNRNIGTEFKLTF